MQRTGERREVGVEPIARSIRVPGMKTLLRCLLIGILVVAPAAACGNKDGGGGKPKPGSSSSPKAPGGY